MWIVIFLACARDGTDTAPVTTETGTTPPSSTTSTTTTTPPELLSRDDGWLRGDLHIHTTYDGGTEDVATVIELAEYLGSETFLSAHPEFSGHHLDFLSITDHRTVEQQSDPGYASDALILVGGEEFGSDGHAGTHGISEFVDHDPDDDGTTLVDLYNAIEATHDQGGTFSPNHPMLPSISWPWDTRDHDGVEVWNAGWALMAPDNTIENVDTWEAEHGIAASPLYRRAVAETGGGSGAQALSWYEAQLMRDIHLAMIGGSDRHAVLLPGFPTTWVKAPTTDEAGVVQGIRDRRTFISRTPASVQLDLSVSAGAETGGIGDALTVTDDSEVTIQVDVSRAEGGLLRLIGGSAVDTDEALEHAELGVVLEEVEIDAERFTHTTTLTVSPGDWVYPLVLESLVPSDATEAQADAVRRIAEAAAATGEEDFAGLATMAAEFVDAEVLVNGAECDPADWDPEMMQCFPADASGLGSFYVPDLLDRGLNAWREDGQITDWCLGAVGSAVLFTDG